MTEKDYSLLRPFDLEAAKAGAELIWEDGNGLLKYVGVPTIGLCSSTRSGDDDLLFIWMDSANLTGRIGIYNPSRLRLAPLCWIDGRPVYPDTPMEREDNGWPVSWSSAVNDWQDEQGNWASGIGFDIRWPRPKPVKRWINIYPGNGYDSKDAADSHAHRTRITCIEIELPPLPAK